MDAWIWTVVGWWVLSGICKLIWICSGYNFMLEPRAMTIKLVGTLCMLIWLAAVWR